MKKKGFTLIELLAVIVILAIIALITVPVVIKIINNAKKGAIEDSAYGVIESAKLFWASKQNDFGKNYSTVEFECTTSKVCSVKTPVELTGSLDISGTKPTGGLVTIQNGEVVLTDLIFGEYKCNTNEDYKVVCSTNSSNSNTPKVTVTFNSNGGSEVASIEVNKGSKISTLPTPVYGNRTFLGWFTEETNGVELTTSTTINDSTTYYAHWSEKTYALGSIVYFDPKTNNTCNSSTFNIDTVNNGSSTCYKWRVISIDENGSNINIQLDHNLGGKVAWVSQGDYNDNINYGTNGNNNKGPITALKALATITDGWSNVANLTYSYDTSTAASNYGILSCSNGDCTINGTALDTNGKKLKARLITGEEIVSITKTIPNVGSIAQNWTLANQTYFYISMSNKSIGTQSDGEGNITLSWLLENTQLDSNYPSGSTNNNYGDSNYGYWTLSPNSTSTNAFNVNFSGILSYNYVSYNSYFGLRPVITISKSKLN